MGIRGIFFLAAVWFIIETCNGSTCNFTYAAKYQTSVCKTQWWGSCSLEQYETRYRQEVGYRCCPGYIGADCLTPICNPSCQNHGKCVSPNNCTCLNGTTGRYCEQTNSDTPCDMSANGTGCT